MLFSSKCCANSKSDRRPDHSHRQATQHNVQTLLCNNVEAIVTLKQSQFIHPSINSETATLVTFYRPTNLHCHLLAEVTGVSSETETVSTSVDCVDISRYQSSRASFCLPLLSDRCFFLLCQLLLLLLRSV